MKRFLGFAVAMFFALVAIALVGGDSGAVAGHGCHGGRKCHGGLLARHHAKKCHGGLLARHKAAQAMALAASGDRERAQMHFQTLSGDFLSPQEIALVRSFLKK